MSPTRFAVVRPEADPILFAVYRPSKEYPEHYVVRRWRLEGGKAHLIDRERPLVIANSLQEARKVIPGGLVRFEREDDDDPAIQESWL